MQLSSFKIFSLKLAIFGVVLAYLAVDLWIWHGPVWGVLHRGGEVRDRNVVARVYGEPVTRQAYSRYIAEQSWLRGGEDMGKDRRVSVLMDLVRGMIVRIRARYNDRNLPDFTGKAREEMQRLEKRAISPEEFDGWLKSQGYTRQTFQAKIARIMKGAALLERAVNPLCEVSDADADKHYELLRGQLTIPAHRRVRQIFLSTLDKKPANVQARAQELLNQLQAGADFERLARNNSEDDATAARGGDLGEVYDTPELLLPELPLFGEGAIPADTLSLARSRWGWHILLAGQIEPAREPSAEESRETLRTAIRSAQRELAVREYLEAAVKEAFRNNHLQIYGE